MTTFDIPPELLEDEQLDIELDIDTLENGRAVTIDRSQLTVVYYEVLAEGRGSLTMKGAKPLAGDARLKMDGDEIGMGVTDKCTSIVELRRWTIRSEKTR